MLDKPTKAVLQLPVKVIIFLNILLFFFIALIIFLEVPLEDIKNNISPLFAYVLIALSIQFSNPKSFEKQVINALSDKLIHFFF